MAALTAAVLAVIAKALTYMGAVKTSTRLKANEIVRAAAEHGYMVKFVWGYDPNAGNTEHHSGLAADFMVFGNKAAGDFIRNYIWTNRSRLRLRHVIWQQHITSTVVEPGVVRAMSDRGNSTANHMDHVHAFFLDDRAYVAPGKPAPKPKAKPKPKPSAPKKRLLRRGVRGSDVAALQRGMNRMFPAYSRLRVDGDFGPNTEAVVKEFQRRVGYKGKWIDGIVGDGTRSHLRKYGINV